MADLERYLADSAADPAPDFADHVMREVASQPTPRRGLWAVLAGTWAVTAGGWRCWRRPWRRPSWPWCIAGQLPRLLPSNIGSSTAPSRR